MKQRKLQILSESAVMIALSVVLSLFKISFPFGGSITLLSMLPIILIALRHGTGYGLISGVIFAVIKLLMGLENFSYIPSWWGYILCTMLDYIIPYGAIGLAGIFRKKDFLKNEESNLFLVAFLGVLAACAVRYAAHTLSGVIVWAAVAEMKGETLNAWLKEVLTYSAWIYSLSYNAAYMVPETVITVIAAPIVVTALDSAGIKMGKKNKKENY